jgi:hypothetical protein
LVEKQWLRHTCSPWIAAFTVAIAGCRVTAIAWLGAGPSVERRTEARFQELASARADRLAFEFERYGDDLIAVAAHIASADRIEEVMFSRPGEIDAVS